jgi:hypothetical protein
VHKFHRCTAFLHLWEQNVYIGVRVPCYALVFVPMLYAHPFCTPILHPCLVHPCFGFLSYPPSRAMSRMIHTQDVRKIIKTYDERRLARVRWDSTRAHTHTHTYTHTHAHTHAHTHMHTCTRTHTHRENTGRISVLIGNARANHRYSYTKKCCMTKS